jgi:hypothetical protein
MSAMLAAGQVDLPRCTDADFIDVVCADEDLLRAEFEAIVAATWPEPPSTPADPLPAAARRPVDRPFRAIQSRADSPPADGDATAEDRGRERSPPETG